MLRFVFLVPFALGLLISAGAAEPDRAQPTLLIVHGAWGGAWQFSKVEPLLREKGFDVRRATLTGLGERAHLATAEIGLETHIQDVVNIILFENLQRVILLGHSYGGMVITGVADRMPERIAQLVYLDAALPEDGESLAELRRGPGSFDFTTMAKDGFIIPTWVRPGKPHPIDVPHPLKTFTDKISLKNPARAKIPSLYILTVDPGKNPDDDDFAPAAARARSRGWPVVRMEADHNPHWRLPRETTELLATNLALPSAGNQGAGRR